MLKQSLRAVRLSSSRSPRHGAFTVPCRTLITPTRSLKADLVQDLYLKELKGFKPTPVKPSDAEGQVQKFAAPKAPQPPEEGDIAGDLKAYEAQQVEIEGQATEGEAPIKEEDWFEEEEEEAAAAH